MTYSWMSSSLGFLFGLELEYCDYDLGLDSAAIEDFCIFQGLSTDLSDLMTGEVLSLGIHIPGRMMLALMYKRFSFR